MHLQKSQFYFYFQFNKFIAIYSAISVQLRFSYTYSKSFRVYAYLKLGIFVISSDFYS